MTAPREPPVRPARIVVLAGGVGGAKLAHGLQAVLDPGDLAVVVNTADDLVLHGLLVMPDHDTMLYTLAGVANREWGWGVQGETFATSAQLERLGAPTWFRLGDRDLATHLVRTATIHDGATIAEACGRLQAAFGLATRIHPMVDGRAGEVVPPVRTLVRTDDGWLEFQEYFVHRHQEPVVQEVRFAGAEATRIGAGARDAIAQASAIVIAPSNPIVSVGPILALPGAREALDAARAAGRPIAAVSPIVGGRALKGPADRMLASLGHEVSALGVARLYAGLVDVFVLDELDAALAPDVEALGMRAIVAPTVMTDDAARATLAGHVLRAVGAAGD